MRERELLESSLGLVEFKGPRHVTEHMIEHAAGGAAIGETAGGVAGSVVVEVLPGLSAIRAAQDALAALERAHEHELGLDGIDVEWAAIKLGEFGPSLAGVGAFEELGGACALVVPVVLMLAVVDKERVLILGVMRHAIDAIGGMGDCPGLTTIMTGVEAGELEALQIDVLAARAGHKSEAVLRLERLGPGRAIVLAFEYAGGQFPLGQTGVLRAKEAGQIRHRPDLLRVRGMRHDILDPSASAGAKGMPDGISLRAGGENNTGEEGNECDELRIHSGL